MIKLDPSVEARMRQEQRRIERCFLNILFVAVFCAGLFAATAGAQALGAITGAIPAPSGAEVPRAKVTTTELRTGFVRTIFSDDGGRYTVPSLRPTGYTLTVEAPGFRKFLEKNVTLFADQTA